MLAGRPLIEKWTRLLALARILEPMRAHVGAGYVSPRSAERRAKGLEPVKKLIQREDALADAALNRDDRAGETGPRQLADAGLDARHNLQLIQAVNERRHDQGAVEIQKYGSPGHGP